MALGVAAIGVAGAHGSFTGRAFGDASNVSAVTKLSNNPGFGLTAKAENLIGGDGAGRANMDFLGGTYGTRNHACVGPSNANFVQSDIANGEATSRVTNELFTVTSATLAVGTIVKIGFCVDITSLLQASYENASYMINANGATNAVSWFFRNTDQTVVGGGGVHEFTNHFGTTIGTGEFAPFAGSRNAHLTRQFTFNAKVGGNITFSMDLGSTAVTTARSSAVGGNTVEASSGLGATVGITSIDPEVKLMSVSQNASFSGTCGDSGGYIPDNPVPEPASLVALVGGLILLRRRGR